METANNINTNNNNSQRMIQEAIRKIALGRSFDRANMSPAGTGGVGTARMIHGYVAKIHDDPNDEEYEEYAGTIDVGEFPDETASSEPIIHKGILLSGLKDNLLNTRFANEKYMAVLLSSLIRLHNPLFCTHILTDVAIAEASLTSRCLNVLFL